MITREEALRIMPYAAARVDTFLPFLNTAMLDYEIVGPLRISAFLAQIAHESGEMRYVEEIASGEAYEGRKDLGNIHAGDGVKFKGRGLLQITGRANYERCSEALFGNDILLQTPELLAQPKHASLSAGWFWSTRQLNQLADLEDFRGITRKINGGYNGYPARVSYYERAKMVLGGGD